MSLKDKMIAAGVKPKRGYVREKIANKSKKRKAVAPARKAEKELGSLAKVIKKAASIAELLTDDDQEENLRVIREAKKATHHVYDQIKKCLVPVPDTKHRLAAVILDLAYREGRPVERSVTAAVPFDELSDRVERFKRSPAAQDFILRLADQIQKSGVEKQVETARVIDEPKE